MADPAHHKFWPPGVPYTLEVGDETLWDRFAARASATPDEAGLHFLGRAYSWRELVDSAERLAAALQSMRVLPGDRVLLLSQNSPQFVIAFHAIIRCGAAVVPLNPMNKAVELQHYIEDAQATVAIAASDVAQQLAQASNDLPVAQALRHLVVFDIADAVPAGTELPAAWRDWLTVRPVRPALLRGSLHEWNALLARDARPEPIAMRADNLALLPYTSGTTGQPKGCMHTHRTLLHNALSGRPWLDMRPGDATLIVVPLFHITGLVMGMLGSIALGCRIVLLPRWDRLTAAAAIAKHRVTHWPNIPTMVIDLLAAPELAQFDLSSLRYIGGGGAPMPEAVAARLREEFGLTYIEGYGLTETSAPTHTNPRNAPRLQCLGIPYIGTRACVVDPETLKPLPTGEVGEILVMGPQVFKGYRNQPEATAAAFVEVQGERWFRTGDLGRVDADGYFYMADRLKRMINASGFKVWPAEVESLLHRHPAVQEVCVIARRDAYRGETVKAVVVPKAEYSGRISAEELIDWSRRNMAAYKYPREIEFADSLPRSGTGKVMWRSLQARQDASDAATAA